MGVKKGLQPLLHTVRVVTRNGASFNIQTTMRRSTPYMLQAVRRRWGGSNGAAYLLAGNLQRVPHVERAFLPAVPRCLRCFCRPQDTTTNPVYTGESAGLSLEDQRMQVRRLW